MIIDLLILVVIGCVLEFLAVRLGSTVFNGCITAGFSLLITFVAVVRWNLWGLLVCPFLALATWYGGSQISEMLYLKETYDWKLILSTAIALCSIGLNVLFFRKNNTSKVINSVWLIGIIMMNYIIFTLVQFVIYRALTSPDFVHVGEKLFESILVDKDGNKEVIVRNLCQIGEGGIVYNLFGLAVMYIGVYVLRSQGVVCNAVQRLIDDKKNAELNKMDQKFSIQEASEDENLVGEGSKSEEE